MPTLFESLAGRLERAGVRHALVVASVHNLELLERLAEAGVTITAARSEIGAAYMADGHARVSGRPTLVVTSTGPGAGNAVGAYATAAKDGAAVIHVASTHDRRPAHALHDVPEQLDWMRAMGRGVHDVAGTGMQSVAAALDAAEWPFAVLVPSADRPLDQDPVPHPAPPGAAAGIDAGSLAPWLEAERRLLWIGGGARSIGRLRLVELAERAGACVFTSVQGKDLFPSDHPQLVACTLNDRDLAELGATSEVALVLGSRLTELSCTSWVRPFPSRIVRVGRSDEVPAFPDCETVHLRAEAADVVDVGLEALRSGRAHGSDHGTEVAASVAEILASRDRSGVEHRYLDAMASVLRPGDTFVCDMTKLAFWSIGGMAVPDGVRFLFPGLLAMGFGLPAALGASLASPDAHVVALVGDGGLVSILSELDLAGSWRGRVSVVLCDDDGYHILRPNMNDDVGPSVCEFAGPQWSLVAAACGAAYVDAADARELATVLGQPHAGVRIVRIDARGIGTGWRRATRGPRADGRQRQR